MMRLLFILMLAVPAVFAQDSNRFESYSAAFTDPAAAADMARAVVGEEGTVALDARGQRLLVLTTDERHAQIADMMKKLNVPPKNVRIEVRFAGVGTSSDVEASVTGDGQVVIEEGVPHGTIRIKPRIINETTTRTTGALQTLLVASGREGILRVGEEVPYIEWFMDYGVRRGLFAQRVGWQQVGSSLVVEPTVVGNGPMIRIRITPQLSGVVDGRPLRTRFAQVATEVYVQDGQTFEIGGSEQNQDFYSRFLVGASRSGRGEAVHISLTPHIAESGVGPIEH
jgi:type II secretory pathway component HofQ